MSVKCVLMRSNGNTNVLEVIMSKTKYVLDNSWATSFDTQIEPLI